MVDSCAQIAPLVIALAWIGGLTLYVLVAKLVYEALKSAELFNGCDKDSMITMAVFFPITFVGLVLYGVGRWVALAYIAATKRDLAESEARIIEKLSEMQTGKKTVKSKRVANEWGISPGDYVTAKERQTDYQGNTMTYEHLSKGCLYRVLSIDSEGSMQVILVDHDDLENQRDYLGNEYKAPARNFVVKRRAASSVVRRPKRRTTRNRRRR